MELKITKDKVLAGAAKCPQAESVLKEMFPEAFPPPPKQEVKWPPSGDNLRYSLYTPDGEILLIEPRMTGPMAGSLWLDSRFTYELREDPSRGAEHFNLVVTRKK